MKLNSIQCRSPGVNLDNWKKNKRGKDSIYLDESPLSIAVQQWDVRLRNFLWDERSKPCYCSLSFIPGLILVEDEQKVIFTEKERRGFRRVLTASASLARDMSSPVKERWKSSQKIYSRWKAIIFIQLEHPSLNTLNQSLSTKGVSFPGSASAVSK